LVLTDGLKSEGDIDALARWLGSAQLSDKMTELPKGSPPTFKTTVPLAGGRSGPMQV